MGGQPLQVPGGIAKQLASDLDNADRLWFSPALQDWQEARTALADARHKREDLQADIGHVSGQAPKEKDFYRALDAEAARLPKQIDAIQQALKEIGRASCRERVSSPV